MHPTTILCDFGVMSSINVDSSSLDLYTSLERSSLMLNLRDSLI